MTATVVQLRAGLRTNLATISGLRVMAGFDRASVPAAQVGEVEIDYDKTMRGSTGPLNEYVWQVRVYVSRADDAAAQDKLDAYLTGTGSIKSAIESDKTLGGVAETLRVTSLAGYGVYEVAGQAYVGAEFTVHVWARST